MFWIDKGALVMVMVLAAVCSKETFIALPMSTVKARSFSSYAGSSQSQKAEAELSAEEFEVVLQLHQSRC